MNKCANCDRVLSCGCQRRVASDGKACCTQCVSGYENSIKKNKATTTPNINKVTLRK